MAKKITPEVVKKFIKDGLKNDTVYVKIRSVFDKKMDCVFDVDRNFIKVDPKKIKLTNKTNWGLKGCLLENENYCAPWGDGNMVGYIVSNSMGAFVIARQRKF